LPAPVVMQHNGAARRYTAPGGILRNTVLLRDCLGI